MAPCPLGLELSRRRGGVATQRPAKPSTPVRFRSSPLGQFSVEFSIWAEPLFSLAVRVFSGPKVARQALAGGADRPEGTEKPKAAQGLSPRAAGLQWARFGAGFTAQAGLGRARSWVCSRLARRAAWRRLALASRPSGRTAARAPCEHACLRSPWRCVRQFS